MHVIIGDVIFSLQSADGRDIRAVHRSASLYVWIVEPVYLLLLADGNIFYNLPRHDRIEQKANPQKNRFLVSARLGDLPCRMVRPLVC